MDKALDEDRTVENYKELLRECYKVLTPVSGSEKPNKIGHWIKEKSRYGWDGKSYVCSECGRSIHLDSEVEDLTDYPYCHCGAQMIESEE
jgi:DNA-directed RNA polymerase subunit RPC12/RpoP